MAIYYVTNSKLNNNKKVSTPQPVCDQPTPPHLKGYSGTKLRGFKINLNQFCTFRTYKKKSKVARLPKYLELLIHQDGVCSTDTETSVSRDNTR